MTERMVTQPDFFEYCESLGFFHAMQAVLPHDFFILFELARTLPFGGRSGGLHEALDSIAAGGADHPDAAGHDIQRSRIMREAPAGETMDIRRLKQTAEIKNIIPSELLLDNDIFDQRLMGKGLRVREFTGAPGDRFLPVSSLEGKGGGEQRLYILLDRSRSMEKNMRSLYSRYIIAEYLRRKRGTVAEFFFRPFDSSPGELAMGTGDTGLAGLLSAVLLTNPRGGGTNIQRALLGAADDMAARREMARPEILLVTDCAGSIDRYEVRERLGDTRVNIVKIGDEYAGPLYSEIKEAMERRGLSFDSPGSTLHDMIHSLGKNERDGLSPSGKDARRFAETFMKNIYDDLRSISSRFIETWDMEPGAVRGPEPGEMEVVISLGEKLEQESRGPLDPDSGKILYKKASFLSQYASFLEKGGNSSGTRLAALRERLARIISLLLHDPVVLHYVSRMDLPGHERKNISAAAEALKKRSGVVAGDISGRRKGLLKMGFAFPAGRHGFLTALLAWIAGAVKRIFHFFFAAGERRS